MAWYNNLPDMRGLIDNADVHSVAVAAVAKLRTLLSAPALWQ